MTLGTLCAISLCLNLVNVHCEGTRMRILFARLVSECLILFRRTLRAPPRASSLTLKSIVLIV